MNYGGEQGAVHCRKEFWDDTVKMLKKDIRFHADVYDLFSRTKNLLRPIRQKKAADWEWCDVSDWQKFDQIVREHNNSKKSSIEETKRQ